MQQNNASFPEGSSYDNRPIGVFDSGLGGLTTFKELRRLFPREDIVYFGDTGRVPYGTKGREVIRRYARQDVEFLLRHQVKMVIAACGTVSSNISPDFAGSMPVPFTGVVAHACAAACAATRNGRIGVIATPATIRSAAYERELKAMSPQAEVFSLPCSLFVPLVENGFIQRDDPIPRLTVERYLASMRPHEVDVLILGCTHYPLLADIIGEFMGPEVTLIDSGKAAAEYTRRFLTRQGMLAAPDRGPGENRFYVSDSIEGFSEVAEIFLGETIRGEVEQVTVG